MIYYSNRGEYAEKQERLAIPSHNAFYNGSACMGTGTWTLDLLVCNQLCGY